MFPPDRQSQLSIIAEKLTRQIPQVMTDLDEIEKRINDTEARASKMTAADVRNVIEEIEANSRVSADQWCKIDTILFENQVSVNQQCLELQW